MPRPLAVSLVAALLCAGWSGAARAESGTGLRLEASLGGGWRTSIDQNDRNPSFEGYSLHAEVAAGPGWGGLSVLFGARGRLGDVANAGYYSTMGVAAPAFPTLYEATGNVSLQVSIGEHIRARAGGDGGMVFVVDRRAPLVGGFLALAVDAATWSSGRMGAIVVLRLDVDSLVTSDDHLPRVSTSLGLGAGIRY